MSSKKRLPFILMLALALIVSPLAVFPAAVSANPATIPQAWLTAEATSDKLFEGHDFAIDGNPNTHWGTDASKNALPQSITVYWPRPMTVSSLVYSPRVRNPEIGVIKQYELYGSVDGVQFELIAEGEWDGEPKKQQTVTIDSATQYRAIRLTAITSSDGAASASELVVTTNDTDVIAAYSELLDTIAAAKTLVLSSKLGTASASKIENSKQALMDEIAKAENLANDRMNGTTEQDVQAIGSLNQAIQAYNSARLQQAIADAQAVLASAGATGTAELQAAIDAASRVAANADLAEVETALSKLLMAQVNADPNAKWIAAWATAPQQPYGEPAKVGFTNQTLRMIVYPTASGSHVRLRFSNVYGNQPLTLDKVAVAHSQSGSDVVPGSHRVVTFDGQTSVTIAPGQEVYSDPIGIDVTDSKPLAVSVFVKKTGPTTFHRSSLQTTYLAYGEDQTLNDGDRYTSSVDSWFWLTSVDVLTDDPDARVIAAIGDSITDGVGSASNTNRRYPDYLNRRIQEEYPDRTVAVLNLGISGNKLLRTADGQGTAAIERFDRDVLSQTGVTDVIILEGINDIGHEPHVYDANKIIEAYKTMINKARAQGLRVYIGTLTPFRGFADGYFTEQGELTRQAVNEWIRTTDLIDGYIDFDKALEDPNNPQRMLPAYDSGDHLHPGEKGYEAMAAAVDLNMLLNPSAAQPTPTTPVPTATPTTAPTATPAATPAPSSTPAATTAPTDAGKPSEPAATSGVIPSEMPKTGMGGSADSNGSGWWVASASLLAAAAAASGWLVYRRRTNAN